MDPTTSTIVILRFGADRSLVLASLAEPALETVRAPFATLVPAFEAESTGVRALVPDLIDRGCVELCCVGPQAEQLHDAIDDIIEARGAFDVATTAVTDVAEACEYFVSAAAGRPQMLLALVASYPDLVAALQRVLRRDATHRESTATRESITRSACLCCECLTLAEAGEESYEICPVCYWEVDPVQSRDPCFTGGANDVSLDEARRNFAACGASDRRFLAQVRPPRPDEMPRRQR